MSQVRTFKSITNERSQSCLNTVNKVLNYCKANITESISILSRTGVQLSVSVNCVQNFLTFSIQKQYISKLPHLIIFMDVQCGYFWCFFSFPNTLALPSLKHTIPGSVIYFQAEQCKGKYIQILQISVFTHLLLFTISM